MGLQSNAIANIESDDTRWYLFQLWQLPNIIHVCMSWRWDCNRKKGRLHWWGSEGSCWGYSAFSSRPSLQPSTAKLIDSHFKCYGQSACTTSNLHSLKIKVNGWAHQGFSLHHPLLEKTLKLLRSQSRLETMYKEQMGEPLSICQGPWGMLH